MQTEIFIKSIYFIVYQAFTLDIDIDTLQFSITTRVHALSKMGFAMLSSLSN